MKKILIIIGGLSILLILLGVWLYMLLFNQPHQAGGDLFADFNLFGNQDSVPVPPPEPETDSQVNVNAGKLRQLTTRPVIGFTEVYSTTTNAHFVTYAEAGTGHLYQIDLQSGQEERISNTTIPNASQAVLSPDGNAAAMRSGFTANSSVVYGVRNDFGGLDNQPLAGSVIDMAFSNTGNLLYSELTASGLRAQQLDKVDQVVSTLFELPFRAVEILWSRDDTTPHYVYTKPNTKLRSYVYEVDNGQLMRKPIVGVGITASANANFIVYNQLLGTEHQGFAYDKEFGTQVSTPIIPIASKCAFASPTGSLMYCGYDITVYDYEFPDSWHKGLHNFSDRIWEVDVRAGFASQLVNPLEVAGREIDVTNMTVSENTRMLYFINKHNQTLWSYER